MADVYAEDNKVTSLVHQRTSVQLSPTVLERLDFIVENGGYASRAEGVRASLQLEHLLWTQEDRGREVVIREATGKNRMVFASGFALRNLFRADKKEKPKQFTVELPAKSVRDIERLKDLSGEKTKSDVLRNAINMHFFLMGEVRSGAQVLVRDRSGEETTLFAPDTHNGNGHSGERGSPDHKTQRGGYARSVG